LCTSPGTELSERDQRIVLGIIAFAAFMASLDSTIVNISLPTIAANFEVDISLVSWVVMAYLLVLAGLLLVFGRLGDMIGFRRVFLAGFSVFTAGSLLCGLAFSIHHLISFRALQGIGGAALEAIAPAMVVIYLPAQKRGRAIGMLATIVSLGIAAGPILGGFITEYLSWHWIFFINVPVGIAAVILAQRFLPADTAAGKRERFDSAGAALILLALITLLFPLNQGLDLGWTSPVILGCFAASLVLWTLFFVHERRCSSPLIDMRLFSNRAYTLANATGFLVMLSYNGTIFLLPFFFEKVQAHSTEFAGLLLAVPAVALMLVGPVAGSLSDRHGARVLTTGAALLTGATLYLFSLFSAASTLPFVIASLMLLGVAIGSFFPPNMSRILGAGARAGEGEGVASGVMMTLRNTGAVLGVALFGTIAVQVIAGTMAHRHVISASPDMLSMGFSVAFTAGILLSILAAAISAVIRDERVQVEQRKVCSL
jgi:EmrB/QacA subfamily drug resistance transporter